MRAQSAVLGIAAAAAISGNASGLPCGVTEPSGVAGPSCTAVEVSPLFAKDRQPTESNPAPAAVHPELLIEAAEADGIEETEVFAARGIKITNLLATMTSNKYVAGRLPLAASRPIDDLITLSPDYLTIKTMAPTPKRSPVGVGLVTVPKPPAKESDKAPEVPSLQPKRP